MGEGQEMQGGKCPKPSRVDLASLCLSLGGQAMAPPTVREGTLSRTLRVSFVATANPQWKHRWKDANSPCHGSRLCCSGRKKATSALPHQLLQKTQRLFLGGEGIAWQYIPKTSEPVLPNRKLRKVCRFRKGNKHSLIKRFLSINSRNE